MAWSLNAMEFAGKDALMEALRADRATFERLVVSEHDWNTQTPCDKWEVRDLVGHMIDNTESYLERFEVARAGKIFPDPAGAAAFQDVFFKI